MIRIRFMPKGLVFYIGKATNPSGGLRVHRQTILYPRACFCAAPTNGTRRINASSFAEHFPEILDSGAVISFGDLRLVNASAGFIAHCKWTDEGGGVCLRDYDDAPPESVGVSTIFNYWWNSLSIENKTSKTSARVVFTPTIYQRPLSLDLVQ